MRYLLLLLILLIKGCYMDNEDNLYLVKQKSIELIDSDIIDNTPTLIDLMSGATDALTPDLTDVNIKMNNAIYQVSGASVNFDENKYRPVGSIIYKYDSSSQSLKFYRKLKNDGWDSNIAVKKRIIKDGYRFDNPCNADITVSCYELGANYSQLKYIFDIPKTSTEDQLLCTAGEYIRSDGSVTPISALWLHANEKFDEWDNITIPIAHQNQGAFILNYDGELWIYEKNENVAFQNGRSDANFFKARDVTDSEYYELLDDSEGFNFVSDENKNKPFDQYTNSIAVFNDSYLTFKATQCSFDFLAVRNFRATSFKIELFDSNDNLISSNTYLVDFNKAETFIHLDNDNAMLLDTDCNDKLYRGDFQFIFDQTYDDTHYIKLSFVGSTELGGLFLGRREKLPCVSRDIKVKYKDFKTASVNEITQTKTINVSEDRLKTTNIVLNFDTHEKALTWLTYLARESYRLCYFDSSHATGLSLLSHGGFIETPEINNKMRAIFFKLNEYNNA